MNDPIRPAAFAPVPGGVDALTPEQSRTAEAVEKLLDDNRRRARLRRRILLFASPVAVIGLLVVVKLLSMFAFAHFSISAYASGDGEGTVNAARGQSYVNWFEPYKAPFNTGDGHVQAGRLAEARTEFESSLALARGLEGCMVRVNLSLVIEAQGDEAARAGDQPTAQKLYREALAVTADTPAECRSEQANEQTSDPNQDLGDTLDENQRRQQEKAKQDQQERPEPSPSPTQPDDKAKQEQQDKLDQLQDKLEQGQRERDDRERGQGGSGGGADKPW